MQGCLAKEEPGQNKKERGDSLATQRDGGKVGMSLQL